MKEFITDLLQKTKIAEQNVLKNSVEIRLEFTTISNNIATGKSIIIDPTEQQTTHYSLGCQLISKTDLYTGETMYISGGVPQSSYGIITNVNPSEKYFSVKPGTYFISSDISTGKGSSSLALNNYIIDYNLINNNESFYYHQAQGFLPSGSPTRLHSYNSSIVQIKGNNNRIFIEMTPQVVDINIIQNINFYLIPLILN